MFVVLEGEGIVTSGDRQWSASAGSIAVAPAFDAARLGEHGVGDAPDRGLPRARTSSSTEFEAPVAPFGVATFVTPVGG